MKLKVRKGRKWSEAEVVRWCQRYCAKIEAHATPGLIKAIEAHIKKSDKAPLNWNQAYRKARLEAKGIKGAVKEKAKKSKFKAGWLLLILVIAVPVLILLYILFTREDKGEGGFELGDKAVDLRGKDVDTLLGDFGHSKPGEKGEPGRPFPDSP